MTAQRLAWLAALPVLVVVGWISGFAWFLHAAWMTTSPPAAADGIVVLTGGADRVETALKLLADGKGRVLLISGVGGAADFAALAHRAGADVALRNRVTLGRTAATTRGNAIETAEWARADGLRSLIVVTAGYHMPRALAELSRAMPDVALYPVAVLPPAMRQPGLLALRLLAAEYTKWLAAESGITSLGAPLEARVAPPAEDPPAQNLPTSEGRSGG
jgi:uncharacterized SAM-binding protein YcdF (DUF218 family)